RDLGRRSYEPHRLGFVGDDSSEELDKSRRSVRHGHLGSRTFALGYRVRGVVSDRLAQQRLERSLVYRVSLAKVDRPPLVPAETGVEELLGVGELRSVV